MKLSLLTFMEAVFVLRIDDGFLPMVKFMTRELRDGQVLIPLVQCYCWIRGIWSVVSTVYVDLNQLQYQMSVYLLLMNGDHLKRF